MLINSLKILCVYLCDILVTFTPLSSLILLPPSQAPPPFTLCGPLGLTGATYMGKTVKLSMGTRIAQQWLHF